MSLPSRSRRNLAQFYADRTLTHSPITPADQAEAFYLLLTNRLSKTTGQVITVDGGLDRGFSAVKINLLVPCFVDQLYPSVGISVVRIFEKLGHTVDFKESILCCGQPAFNAGFWEESREIAVRVLQSFERRGSGRGSFRFLRGHGKKFLPGTFSRPNLRRKPPNS